MAVAEWSDNGEYFIWRGEVWIPKNFDPTTKACVIMLGPPGGTAMVPAMVQGDPGQPFTPRNVILTELEHDDPTAASAEWILITPATDLAPPVMDLQLTLHAGEPGAPGTMTILTATDLDKGAGDANLKAGWTVAVNADLDGFDLVPPTIGGTYWPASIPNTALGAGPARAVASQTVPAQPRAWRPRSHGQVTVTGNGADLRTDLIVRTNQNGGEIVARTYGVAGQYPPPMNIVNGPPLAAGSDYGIIPAGVAGVISMRVEQQAGINDYTTTFASFCVEVAFVP